MRDSKTSSSHRTAQRTGRKRGLPFRALVVVPLVVALVAQALICYVVVFRSNSLGLLEDDTYGLFAERVASRSDNLENDMVQRWSAVDNTVQAVRANILSVLAEHGASASDIETASPLAIALVEGTADEVVSFVNRAGVDGAFLILVSDEDEAYNGEATARSGFHVLDSNPQVGTLNSSDLLIDSSPISVTKRFDIALSSTWTPVFHVPEAPEDAAFYTRPIEAAVQYPSAAIGDLGYWGRPADVGDNGTQSVTYTVPIRDAAGTVCAVFGIEVDVDRVASYFPYRDLGTDGRGSYVLAASTEAEDGSTDFAVLASTGALQSLYAEEGVIRASENEDGYLTIAPIGATDESALAFADPLNLYDANSPYVSEQWCVVGLEQGSVLFDASITLERNLTTVFGASFGIGVVLAALIAWFSSSRLRLLMREVRSARPSDGFVFTATGVREIDELADSISSLGSDLASAGQRLSQIMALSDRAVGAFEYRWDTGEITFTDKFFEILGVEDYPFVPARLNRDEILAGKLDAEGFSALMDSYMAFADKEPEGVYVITLPHQNRILRFVVTDEQAEGRAVGLIEDVTREMQTRRRIEHERDHDILTGLLNRRAFEQEVVNRFAEDDVGFAAMGMFDLDNLKFMNDSYGHDWGDQYIQAAARAIRSTVGPEDLCSRVSGDEFLLFVLSCECEYEVEALFEDIRRAFSETVLEAPDGRSVKVRGSVGVALYPKDATGFSELREYADFAMYTAKNNRKGELCFFDRARYDSQASLLGMRDDLDRLLDETLVDYHFQPIVDARTGEVFAYEALMRPQLESLNSPAMVIELARMQSKLYRVEQMTFTKALRAFEERDNGSDAMLFVNSIATQSLTFSDERAIEKNHAGLLKRLVIEITEGDYGRDMFGYKEALAERWGSELAIDDFGSGYNGDTILLELGAQFVKIDMEIIHGIDKDVNRQDILRSLLSYAHDRGLSVIAEGVETKPELACVIGLGVDYIQGYFVAKPEWDPRPVDPAVQTTIVDIARRVGC